MNARWTVAILIAAAAVVANPTAVAAQDQTCEFNEAGDLLCIQVITAVAGGPNLDVPLDPTLPLLWRRVRANGVPGATFTCSYETVDGNLTTIVNGVGWATMLINTDTGEIISLDFECEYPGEDPPLPPPPPPTVLTWQEANEDVLRIDTQINPDRGTGGITGLDLWFWCSDPGGVSTEPLVADGWTVTATVEPVAFQWAISGTGASHAAGSCGSAPSIEEGTGAGAAWTWEPQRIGTVSIEFTSTWVGSWTLDYLGTNTGTFVLGPVPISAVPVSYPIAEFVGVLVDEADDG